MLNPVERYKWQAWKDVEGQSREQAMAAYIAEVEAVEAQYG